MEKGNKSRNMSWHHRSLQLRTAPDIAAFNNTRAEFLMKASGLMLFPVPAGYCIPFSTSPSSTSAFFEVLGVATACGI